LSSTFLTSMIKGLTRRRSHKRGLINTFQTIPINRILRCLHCCNIWLESLKHFSSYSSHNEASLAEFYIIGPIVRWVHGSDGTASGQPKW